MDLRSEWLEADGLGGFASGTVAGIRTRRYHALLLHARRPPAERMVLVSGFDAWLDTPAGSWAISSQAYLPDAVHPDGAARLASFSCEPWPRWRYRLPGGRRLEQELFVPRGSAAVVVRWRLAETGPGGPATLRVRPFLSGRDYHALHHENSVARPAPEERDGLLCWSLYPDVPAVSSRSNGRYAHAPLWYRQFRYDEERARGLDDGEDLAAPGELHFDLGAGDAVWLLAAEGHEKTLGAAEEPARAAADRLAREEIVRLDPRFDALVGRGANLERIVDGHEWLEGPLWDPADRSLLFADVRRNAVYRWRAGAGVSVVLAPSGYSGTAPFAGPEPGANGLAFDAVGRLLLCQHGDRRIARRRHDGTLETLVGRYGGRRLNSPNDLVLRANGEIWFSDPPFGLPGGFEDAARELGFAGVFRLGPGGRLQLATRDVPRPNGLAFSPDERTLYVSNADPLEPLWLAFPVRRDGALGPPRVWFDARLGDLGPNVAERPGSPDGLEVDHAGHVFAAGPGGVWVLAPEGESAVLLGRIDLGVATSNVAWGEDGRSLFVTAGGAIWRLRTETSGW
ncbi:MAG TPA: glycogen debranching enzyme N-terminal domain-containing protein [Myxococcota bacterium]|nr:glycogen debranching enzyme N-terminal domain-containing protein [Myxococcota bacterium]